MLNTFQGKTNRVGDTVLAASRQMWLAGLGAAVMTRDWAEKEAGGVFRTLVKEGAAVESRAIRLVGVQVESSMTKANAAWKQTRTTVDNAVLAHRLCNKLDHFIRNGLSIEKDLARVRRACEETAGS